MREVVKRLRTEAKEHEDNARGRVTQGVVEHTGADSCGDGA